jgi:hypothetical protein
MAEDLARWEMQAVGLRLAGDPRLPAAATHPRVREGPAPRGRLSRRRCRSQGGSLRLRQDRRRAPCVCDRGALLVVEEEADRLSVEPGEVL